MIPSQRNIISEIKKRKGLRRRILAVIMIMSFMVSGEVFWKLRSIVVTLANDPVCGIEEHTHSETCYQEQTVCGEQNKDDHIHSDICYQNIIVCNTQEHIHNIECYNNDETFSKKNDNMNIAEVDSVIVSGDSTETENSDKIGYSDNNEILSDSDQQISLLAEDPKPGVFYIDSGNGINIEMANTESTRYKMILGASFMITFYDDKNTQDYFYDMSDTVSVQNNSASTENGMRKVTAKIVAAKTGDTAVMISGISFHISISERAPNMIYSSTGNDEKTYFGSTESDRYNILKGDRFKVIIYDTDNTNNYFYDPDNSGKIKISNSQTTLEGNRILTAVITATGEGNVTVGFRDKRFYINVIDRSPGVIYLVNGDKENLQSQNSISNRNIFSPGDKFSLCIYERAWEETSNYFQDTSYMTGVTNLMSVANTQPMGSYSGQVRKVAADITLMKDGDGQISFGDLTFYITVKSYQLGKLFMIDSHGNEIPVENTDGDRYIMSKDETFTLCYYEQKSSAKKEWFHCSTYKNPDDNKERVVMNYSNSDRYVADNVRKITATFIAINQGKCTVTYKDSSFYVDVRLNYAKKNVIYVDTALGEREKDKVHEYISENGGDETQTDGKYYYNTSSNRYVVYVGEFVDLSVYLDPELSNRYFYADSSQTAMTSGSANKSNVLDKESGLRKSSARYTAVKPGNFTAKVDTGEGTLYFYVIVRDPDKNNSWEVCDHADIEVSDGGSYEITKTVIYADGTSITTKTNYDSYIIAVNLCELFDLNSNLVMTYFSTDYQLRGNPGETQYELTSKYLCAGKPEKQYNPGLVRYAKFNVKMLLKPDTMTVIKRVNGEITDIKEIDATDDTGNSDLTLPNVEFILQNKSKVDALNKCPNHSGLDYNVAAALNDVITIPPVMAEIELDKQLIGQSITDRQFSFSLIDEEGKVVNTVYNDINGKIVFDHYFHTPGTYNFTIRENIPDKPGNYKYDTSIKRITVTVTEQNVDGQKVLIPKVTYNTDTVFRNVVSLFTDINVIKSWTDGNDHHSGDSIFFVIYRKKNNESEEIISINGISKFELSAASGWSKTFTNLPVQEGETRYTYRIEEDYVRGYTARYFPGTIDSSNASKTTILRITNSLKDPTSISILKKWTDSTGKPMTGKPVSDSVTAVIKREFKRVKIPVTIELYSSVYPEKLIAQFRENAYTGSDFSFTVHSDMNKVRVSSVRINNTRNGQYNNNLITVKNIEYGDIVRVYCDRQYSQALDGEFFIRQSFTGTREEWGGRGALVGDAYSTYYTSSGSGGSQAIKIYNRTAQWNGAALGVNGKLVPGKKYSISAYAMWRNVFTDSSNNVTQLADHSTDLIVTLQYTGKTDNQLHYTGVYSKNASANTWTLLENTEFKVPDDAVNPYLVIETSENISGKFSDIYLDEVTIAEEGTIVSVSTSGIVYIGNASDYGYSKTGEMIPDDIRQTVDNWTLDTMDTWKEVVLKASENWMATISADELNEQGDRIYRYYVSEKNKVDGFEKIDPTDKVTSNTVSDPLIIENRQIQYLLPSTGGTGTEKYITVGKIIAFLSVIYFLYHIFKKSSRKDSV